MKRWIAMILLALVGFYVAWPAWSGYRIATALSNEDEGLLESKIDFPRVRESLRPAVMAEIGKSIDKGTGTLGPMAQVLGASAKQQMTGAVVEQVLAVMITPRSVIRIAKDGGDLASGVQKAMADAGLRQGGQASAGALPAGGVSSVLGQVMGGLKQPDASSQTAASAEPVAAKASEAKQSKASFGLGNIKGFRLAGPFGFDVDVARDAALPKADVTVGMAFTGADWKLTRVVPVP